MLSTLRGRSLFEAVMDHIEQHPEEHDQRNYALRVDGRFVGCIAGLAVRLAEGEGVMRWQPALPWMAAAFRATEYADPIDMHRRATTLLGISADEADSLFSASNNLHIIRDIAAEIWPPVPA